MRSKSLTNKTEKRPYCTVSEHNRTVRHALHLEPGFVKLRFQNMWPTEPAFLEEALVEALENGSRDLGQSKDIANLKLLWFGA